MSLNTYQFTSNQTLKSNNVDHQPKLATNEAKINTWLIKKNAQRNIKYHISGSITKSNETQIQAHNAHNPLTNLTNTKRGSRKPSTTNFQNHNYQRGTKR